MDTETPIFRVAAAGSTLKCLVQGYSFEINSCSAPPLPHFGWVCQVVLPPTNCIPLGRKEVESSALALSTLQPPAETATWLRSQSRHLRQPQITGMVRIFHPGARPNPSELNPQLHPLLQAEFHCFCTELLTNADTTSEIQSEMLKCSVF